MTSSLNEIQSVLRDPRFCRSLLDRLEKTLDGKPFRFMEVCGTHTAAIFQSGLRSLLPKNVAHLSGPGCPVCVTHETELGVALAAAEKPGILIATYGDLLRVPGPAGRSLASARADGARVEIVYSPLDAVNLAANNPDTEIIFLGVGFETTAPGSAAAIKTARVRNLGNFSLLSFHKLVPPALRLLAAENKETVNAFLLPGHVAAITGLAPFEFLAEEFNQPAAVGGFEPADILLALVALAEQSASGSPSVVNRYERAVKNDGNPRARSVCDEVFVPANANWRGLGLIPCGGLILSPAYENFDAAKKHDLSFNSVQTPNGCRCGAILQGKLAPPQCPLFGKACTPASPVGPCMVSTEGSCAAYFKYGDYLA